MKSYYHKCLHHQKNSHHRLLPLLNNRGETLLEGVISLLVFTLLIIAVTLMLNWAIRETSSSIREGNDIQNEANNALLGNTADEPDTFILSVTIPDEPFPIPIPIPVLKTDFDQSGEDDDFIAFYPPSPSE
jgi:hypothetical protein